MPGTGGLGVNEAMAYGLPIISTEGDETVVDLIEGNGFLLQHMGNVEEQKAAIKKFVELPATEKSTMSQKSLELILKKAPLKNMVEKHVIACERMIGYLK
jgi:glycosyltransferase involved in cell wall biosynthesis